MALYEKTVYELKDLLNKKEVSSEDVVKSYLNRINDIDSKIGAFITICEDEAIKNAKEIDSKRMKGEVLGALAGIPIGIKDNICTKDILTTCASKMLHNFIPPYNATVIKKIYDEGIIILGKLNMDEFAIGSSNETSYYKKTKNPWNIEYVPGGSSGGSAASVAADEIPFSLGSDTGGSIRQPAHFCGVVGMKPTYGSVSRYGLVAVASSLDQIGPITKNVEDMALALNVICGHDPLDSCSFNINYPDFTKSLNQDIKGMRIALPKEYLDENTQKEVKDSVLAAAKKLEDLGAVVEEVSLDLTKQALLAYYIISTAEVSSNLARYDGIKYGYRAKEYEDLEDLYKKSRTEGFGEEIKKRILLGTYFLSEGYYDIYYLKAQQIRTLVKNQFDKLFENYDVVLTPTSPTTAFKIGENTNTSMEMSQVDNYTQPVNLAGLPAISINSGFDLKGLPIGIQFIGKAFEDSTLIKVAHAFEKNNTINKLKPVL